MSDLIFFTGFEGCTSTADVENLIPIGRFIHGGLHNSMGYMGSKGTGLSFYVGVVRNYMGIPLSGLTTKSIAMGGHFDVRFPLSTSHNFGEFTNIFRIHSSDSPTITICTTNTEIVLRLGGAIFEVIPTWYRPHLMYQHASVLIDKSIGKIQIVLNQEEIYNKSGLDIPSHDFFSTIYWDLPTVISGWDAVVYWDNIWAHTNKILGEVRSFYSLPVEDGYWNKDNGGFQPSSGSYLHPMLQTNSATNFVTSSEAGHKFTCKQSPIPEGFTPLGFTLQQLTRTMEAGGKLGLKNLVRFDDNDYTGRRFFAPDKYLHNIAFRESFDVMPDGSMITREKLNDLEFGIELVE